MYIMYVPTFCVASYTSSYIHTCVLYIITGNVDVNIEAVSALSNAHQLNKVDNSILECFINEGASDDSAVKCCISNHYHHEGRRRFVTLEAAATNNQCM